MLESARDTAHQTAGGERICFEQPLTERMRTFLRIEFLYHQVRHHAGQRDDFGARAAVQSLLEILAIVGRGDVRGEVIKELDRHAELLRQYSRRAGIDTSRCTALIDDIGNLKSRIAATGKKIATALRECEFLTTINQRSSIPGGTCMFDLPDYAYWLRLPYGERSAHLDAWMNELTPLCDSIGEVLWLTREWTDPVDHTAVNGLYHHSLDRNASHSMVRVEIPLDARLFPEISAGQHRFTIRFLEWVDVDTRPRPVGRDVQFSLALC